MKAITQVLGPDHGFTLISRTHFALVLHDVGRLDEAEAEIRAVLDLRYITSGGLLGPGHPDTAALADALRNLRHPEKPA